MSTRFGLRKSFRVNARGRGDVGAAHQLLHHVDILIVGFEQRGIGVAEGMEADPFGDASLLRGGLQEAVQQGVRPGRHFALNSLTGKDPILRPGITGFFLPGQQLASGERVDRPRLARSLCLALPWMTGYGVANYIGRVR